MLPWHGVGTGREDVGSSASVQCSCSPHLYRVHPVHPRGLEDRVVRLMGGVQDPIREVFPAHEDAMEVAFCPAVGDVTPVVILVDLPQSGKPLQDPHLCRHWTVGPSSTACCDAASAAATPITSRSFAGQRSTADVASSNSVSLHAWCMGHPHVLILSSARSSRCTQR